MSSPQGSKPSKWGSFLQQAVAGVESRLDTMLAAEEEAAQRKALEKKAVPRTEKEEASPRPSLSGQRVVSRDSSSSRGKVNERLQERLAKAVARRSSPVSASSHDEKVRVSGPTVASEGRTSFESNATRPSLEAVSAASEGPSVLPAAESDGERLGERAVTDDSKEGTGVDDRPESQATSEVLVAGGGKDGQQPAVIADMSEQDSHVQEDKQEKPPEPTIGQAAPDTSENDRRRELNEYIEKIDALQNKLKYLTQQAAESAKNAYASTTPGSLEKKLLEKDEQIANLMAEGNKLSKTELKYRSDMKKLRLALADKIKAQSQLQKEIDSYEDELLQKTEELQSVKQSVAKNGAIAAAAAKKEKELATAISERDALSLAVSDLNQKLSEANARAEQAEQAARRKSTETDKRRAQEAQDDLAQSRLEKELSDSKHQKIIQELKDSLEREKEKSRLLEVELGAERTALEQKMETLRSRAEEASSSASGDARAKLLRQIETLQSQYSIASENWQRIEGSLAAKLATVERERDELEKSENDIRKKLRETSLRARKSETELESSRDTIRELQRDLESVKRQLEKLTKKHEETERHLTSAKEEVVRQQQAFNTTLQQRLEEERLAWQESLVATSAASEAPPSDFPVTYSRKCSLIEQDRTPSSRAKIVATAVTSSESLSKITPPARHHHSGASTPSIALRRRSSNDFSVVSSVADLPTITSLDGDDAPGSRRISMQDDRALTHGSFGNTHSRGVNDLISASTVGAGPSVQLVERMSATVRRLESERAASKDELARLTAQRDEARQEVVALMREVEEKRRCDERIKELSATLEDLDQRYNTTLEMLGEKSEQVEELQADVAELKRIYRELVDSTMK